MKMEKNKDIFDRMSENLSESKLYIGMVEKLLQEKIDSLDGRVKNLEEIIETFREDCVEHRMEIQRDKHGLEVIVERQINQLKNELIEINSKNNIYIKWVIVIMTGILSTVFSIFSSSVIHLITSHLK